MGSEWEYRPLGDCGRWLSGGTPSKRNAAYWNGDIPWISAKAMIGSKFRDSKLKVTELGVANGTRMVPKDTLLLLVRGSMLHQRIPVGLSANDVSFNQDVKALIPSDDFLPRFLLYWFLANEPLLLSKVENTSIGAGRLATEVLNAIQVPCPNIGTQRAIAHILGSLDDKIELNRRMSETLEGMARAIFRSWFVDFDPVRAKAEGRQPDGMDADTAALFPDSFQDSPLGRIPKAWKVGSVGDIGSNRRHTTRPEEVEEGTAYIGLEHMPKKCISLLEWGEASEVSSAKSEVQQGDILFGKLRPYFHKTVVSPIDAVCSTDILVLAPSSEHWFGFLLFVVSSDEFVAYTDASSTGTRMPRTNWRDMARYEIALPPLELAGEYSAQVSRVVNMIRNNIFQSKTLAMIRDTLLPKLISGELRVPDAEKLVEEAGL